MAVEWNWIPQVLPRGLRRERLGGKAISFASSQLCISWSNCFPVLRTLFTSPKCCLAYCDGLHRNSPHQLIAMAIMEKCYLKALRRCGLVEGVKAFLEEVFYWCGFLGFQMFKTGPVTVPPPVVFYRMLSFLPGDMLPIIRQ